MKKLLLYIAIAGVFFSSCSKFLEEENLSTVTAESYYKTKAGFTALVNANYSQLREIYGAEPWLFCAGTDLYAEGRSQEPTGLSQYATLSPSSEGVDALYISCYKAIQLANMGLHYANSTEVTTDLPVQIGELKFLRASAYFLLVQTYGGVGIVKDYINSPVLQFDRNSAEEVYAFILSDLEEALSTVSTTAYTGHANKRAVQDLLAKVHLTRGYETFGTAADFTKAASYAEDAIAGQALSIPFATLWKPGNEMNAEVIFSVQFSAASQATSPSTLGNKQGSYFSSYLGGSEVAGKAPYRTYTLCPTDFAIGLYEQGDARWQGTFMVETYTRYYDYYDVADHSALTVTHYYAPKWATDADLAAYATAHPKTTIHKYGTYGAGVVSSDYQTIPVRKFDDPKAPFGDGRVSTRDIILSRLAETYLVAAEAYLKTGQTATGLDRLNAVRKRAGVADASLAEFNIDYILDERARELLGEYHRWFDLKRTGKLVERASAHHYKIKAENFVGVGGNLKILRPIPQAAIDLNQNKAFPQNPAYN